jgi:putative tricarboxylic transport membrane protein
MEAAMPPELFAAASMFLDPVRLLLMLFGVLVGIFFGIIPGLGAIFSVAMLLSVVHHMDVATALAMLMGALAVVNTADSTSSVLLGTPGSAAAVPTAIEGHPMAKRGEAARALSAAYLSSLIGGLLGVGLLTLMIPFARPLALSLGAPELFMACVLGISLTATFIGHDVRKGLMAAGLGLLLGTIGPSPAAPVWRFTQGQVYLMDGLSVVIVAIGLFGLAEVISLLSKGGSIARERVVLGPGWRQGLRDVVQHWNLVARGTLIGVWAGILPVLGAIAGTLMAYAHTIAIAKDKSQFGRGDVRGIIAPEASSNSLMAGQVVPTLFFSIPGSVSMAMLMGALLSFGILPGPRFVTDHLDLLYVIVWSLALSNVVGAAICFGLAPLLARVTYLPFSIVAPGVIMAMTVGAYQSTRDMGDLVALFLFGLLGWVMKETGWPRAALLIGFVLAGALERYVFLTVRLYPDFVWLLRPIVLLLIVLIIAPFVTTWYRNRRQRAKVPGTGAAIGGPVRPAFTLSAALNLLMTAAFAWAVYEAAGYHPNARLAPWTVAIPGFALGVLGILWLALGRGEVTEQEAAEAQRTGNGTPMPVEDAFSSRVEQGRAGLLWLGLAAYFAAIPLLGFRVSTVLLLSILLWGVARASVLGGLIYMGGVFAFLELIGGYFMGMRWPTGWVGI